MVTEDSSPSGTRQGLSGDPTAGAGANSSHWVRWHEAYEDPVSPLSLRLRLVQDMVRDFLDALPEEAPSPVRVVSMCAGQGRDVIDVLAAHRRRDYVTALLVEFDPELVAFARDRAAEAGVAEQVSVIEGDASLCRWYADAVPVDLVLACGLFGNISAADITRTIRALPGFCRMGSEVIWTRHRRHPDATPTIRAEFEAAGFREIAFAAPDGYVLSVGRHRLAVPPPESPAEGVFDPETKLFEFVGDGFLPA
jgi:hypothetical protein